MRRSGMRVMIRVKLTVRNPRNLSLQGVGNFLVDTGACFTGITNVLAKRLKIRPYIKSEFILANGEKVNLLMAYVYLEFENDRILTLVTLAEGEDSCRLGLDVLEALKIRIDTSERKLLMALTKKLRNVENVENV